MSNPKPHRCWSCRDEFSPNLLDTYVGLAHLAERPVKLCAPCAFEHLRSERLPEESAGPKAAVQLVESAFANAESGNDAEAAAWARRRMQNPRLRKVTLDVLRNARWERGGAA